MIKLTIQDAQDIMSFDVELITPIELVDIINETDVETIDGNISTYYGSTKRQYNISLTPMTQQDYSRLRAFVKRQYEALKYPVITVTGATELNVEQMTAKISLSDTQVISQCGLVDTISITLRESKQMP